jgi:hypothetical protein
LLDQDNIRYDLAEVHHLGVISAYPWIWLASKQSGVSVADACSPAARSAGAAPG